MILHQSFFEIPYPPSVNTYWGFHGHRRFLTPKALEFKAHVAHVVSLQDVKFGDARLRIKIVLHAPDKRVRDIDNVLKPTLDAFVQAGLLNDDSQVDELTVIRGKQCKGGKAEIYVASIQQ